MSEVLNPLVVVLLIQIFNSRSWSDDRCGSHGGASAEDLQFLHAPKCAFHYMKDFQFPAALLRFCM